MAKRLVIVGRVQGVGYRASLAQQARSLGLAGWVCNRHDGAVEACIDGDALAVNTLITWARSGPPAALVSTVTVDDVAGPAAVEGGFSILPTR